MYFWEYDRQDSLFSSVSDSKLSIQPYEKINIIVLMNLLQIRQN